MWKIGLGGLDFGH